MANFVRIGKRIVNLDNVTEAVYEPQGGMNYDRPCVRIDFIGGEDYISVDKEREPEAFSQLMTWMDERPTLLQEGS